MADRDRRPYYRRAPKTPRVCQFCVDKVEDIDYKRTDLVSRLISEQGKIKPRRHTGTCARHQRKVATAIKRARHMALLPFTSDIGGG